MGLPNERGYFGDTLLASRSIIPIDALLSEGVLPGKITEIQATIEEPEDIHLFCQLLRKTFGLTVHPRQILTDKQSIEEPDQLFFTEFGYAAKNLAVARIRDRLVEAWTGPTLVRKDHPMYRVMDRRSVYVACDLDSEEVRNNDTPLALARKNQIFAARYFRTKVLDKPEVLASVCAQLGADPHRISILAVLQPQTRRIEGFAEIAFLLKPSHESNFHSAINRIRGLSTVDSISSVFRVISDPASDINK